MCVCVCVCVFDIQIQLLALGQREVSVCVSFVTSLRHFSTDGPTFLCSSSWPSKIHTCCKIWLLLWLTGSSSHIYTLLTYCAGILTTARVHLRTRFSIFYLNFFIICLRERCQTSGPSPRGVNLHWPQDSIWFHGYFSSLIRAER